MIRVGVAGWDYADWRGPVYPSRAGGGFDRLAYLARFVDVIEINSSFYRPVAPRTAESWLRRTETLAEFRFTAKAHRSCTHEREAAPPRAVRETTFGLRPLLEAGRLGALLLQFPQSFHYDAASRAHVERLLPELEGWPLAIEVRHRSWGDPRAESWLRRLSLGFCAVDQPRVGPTTLGALTRVTGDVGYLRLHGRNVGDWFRAGAGRDERYDYLYGEPELDELADAARRIDETAATTYVVQNNHFRGQAVVNALQMKRRFEGRDPLAPPALVAAYPQLRGSVRLEEPPLF